MSPEAALERIAAIHQPTYEPDGIPLCLACGDGTGSDDWPCATFSLAVGDFSPVVASSGEAE